MCYKLLLRVRLLLLTARRHDLRTHLARVLRLHRARHGLAQLLQHHLVRHLRLYLLLRLSLSIRRVRRRDVIVSLNRALRDLQRLHRVARVLLRAYHVRVAETAALFHHSGRDGKALCDGIVSLSCRQRVMLQLLKFVTGGHVPKLLTSVMI